MTLIAPRTVSSPPTHPGRRSLLIRLLRGSVAFGFLGLFAFFSVAAPGFLSWTNLGNILVNNFAILALVSLGLTLVVSAGGIDLSTGTAVDLASLFFVSAVAARHGLGVAVAAGLSGALVVGALNGLLIAGLRITPFLASLGTLFMGESAQQLLTNGGQPIYLINGDLPAGFTWLGTGTAWGLPAPLLAVLGFAAAFTVLLYRTPFGRQLTVTGVQPGVALYSGLRVRVLLAVVQILTALTCGVAGLLLSSTVKAYVPMAGNAYLLDAIGATFLGTTLHPESRPSIAGTLLGVLLLSVLANGLLLIGWNFYWQQVATGMLVFLVLAVSFTGRRLRTES